jgi:PIN domain-containing protein
MPSPRGFNGEIRDRLRLKGRPIPENDIWIAATAVQHGLPLATRDDHFKEVEAWRLKTGERGRTKRGSQSKSCSGLLLPAVDCQL